MRKLPSLTIALLFALSAFSQSSKNLFNALKIYSLSPASVYPFDGSIAFSKIEVVDKRFDTSKLGFMRRGYNFRKLTEKKSTSEELNVFLNKHLKNNFSQTS